MERTGIIKFQGNPLTLVGDEVNIGNTAPDFTCIDKELNEKSLKDYEGYLKVISVTPSLDTPVCNIQLRKFNEEASKLGDDIKVLNISMDLPFAIARFCTTHGINKVEALSDYKYLSFGKNYGILIKELKLLARSIFIIGKDNKIKYIEIVEEVTNEPDYEKAFEALSEEV